MAPPSLTLQATRARHLHHTQLLLQRRQQLRSDQPRIIEEIARQRARLHTLQSHAERALGEVCLLQQRYRELMQEAAVIIIKILYCYRIYYAAVIIIKILYCYRIYYILLCF